MDGLRSCPHCGSEVKFAQTHGNMKSFPSVDIVCTNEECYGSMHVVFDEFSTDVQMVKSKMLECWNRRVSDKVASIA